MRIEFIKPQSYPVEGIGILQQMSEQRMWMVVVEFSIHTVPDYRRPDGLVVRIFDALLGEQSMCLGHPLLEPAHRISAMSVTHAIVGASQIVEVDRGPQTNCFTDTPCGLNQVHGMDHHPSDVPVAVNIAVDQE